MEAGIEQLIITASYAGIFGLMLLNGVLSVFPSSQVIYIVSGYFVYTGDLELILGLILGAIGNTIGGTILYYLVREKGTDYVRKFTLIPEDGIKKAQIVFEKHGAWFLFVGRILPALKVFMPIVAGVAKMKIQAYVPIFFLAALVWAGAFMSIGMIFGKSSDFFGRYAIILFVVAAIVVGIFYKTMQSPWITKELHKKKK